MRAGGPPFQIFLDTTLNEGAPPFAVFKGRGFSIACTGAVHPNLHSRQNVTQPSLGANVRDYPAFENRKGWGSLIVEIQSVENQRLGQPPHCRTELDEGALVQR